MWYRVTLATGPGWVGQSLIAHCRRADGLVNRTLVVSGGWVCAMPTQMIHALAASWEEETDKEILACLEKRLKPR